METKKQSNGFISLIILLLSVLIVGIIIYFMTKGYSEDNYRSGQDAIDKAENLQYN